MGKHIQIKQSSAHLTLVEKLKTLRAERAVWSKQCDANVVVKMDAEIQEHEQALSLLENVPSSLDLIADAVLVVFSITRDQFQSRNRKWHLTAARQYYCYFAKQSTDASLAAIGSLIRRDHSTVWHSVRMATDRIVLDKRFNRYYNRIKTLLK